MSVNFPEPEQIANTSDLNIAILYSRFNEKYTSALANDCKDELIQHKVEPNNIFSLNVPGAYELPFIASKVLSNLNFDALIILGAVIAGDTNHHLAIEQSVASSLQTISIDFNVPIINGVITVENEQQAIDRCLDPMRRGREFAQVALEMASKSILFDGLAEFNEESDI